MAYKKHIHGKYTNGTSRSKDGITLYGKTESEVTQFKDRHIELTVNTSDMDSLVTMLATWQATPYDRMRGHQDAKTTNQQAAQWLRELADKLEARPY